MQEISDFRIKRGYLEEDYRLFHIRDKRDMEFESHYHEFNKIIIFISGNVTYLIEGKSYRLKPWDILIINQEQVHRVMVNSDEIYERIVIWANSKFLQEHSSDDCNLLSCFEFVLKRKFNLLRFNTEFLREVKATLGRLANAQYDRAFGADILGNALFIQLMVYINRLFFSVEANEVEDDIVYDKSIIEILEYINKNLSEDLGIEVLASKFFLNKYYLMHKFKIDTGYTIHSYILQKRLILANNLLKEGKPVYTVCMECGFNDYSSFVKAFKKLFGASPKKYLKTLKDMDREGK